MFLFNERERNREIWQKNSAIVALKLIQEQKK